MELILHFLIIGGQRLPNVKPTFTANTVYSRFLKGIHLKKFRELKICDH